MWGYVGKSPIHRCYKSKWVEGALDLVVKRLGFGKQMKDVSFEFPNRILRLNNELSWQASFLERFIRKKGNKKGMAELCDKHAPTTNDRTLKKSEKLTLWRPLLLASPWIKSFLCVKIIGRLKFKVCTYIFV